MKISHLFCFLDVTDSGSLSCSFIQLSWVSVDRFFVRVTLRAAAPQTRQVQQIWQVRPGYSWYRTVQTGLTLPLSSTEQLLSHRLSSFNLQ